MLVLAGAGTGKTRVLTTRIAHILATGLAYPSQILAVTFTNKAAREMKQRIGMLVGEAVEGMPWLGTFHSIGVKLLRRHAELAGLRSDFTILDTDDVIRLMKQLIQAEGLDDKRWPARQFAMMIDGWKNKGLGPAEIPEGDARAFANGKGRELYRRLPGAAEDTQRLRLRRPSLPPDPHLPRQSRRARRNITAGSDTSSSTNTRTPTPRSTCGCGCWRRGRTSGTAVAPSGLAIPAEGRKPDRASGRSGRPRGGPAREGGDAAVSEKQKSKSAASATTTSRSMAGAARRSTTSCASTRISRRDHHPAGAQLPLDRPHPRRRLPPHRPQ